MWPWVCTWLGALAAAIAVAWVIVEVATSGIQP
jgi:hypothetical protein